MISIEHLAHVLIEKCHSVRLLFFKFNWEEIYEYAVSYSFKINSRRWRDPFRNHLVIARVDSTDGAGYCLRFG